MTDNNKNFSRRENQVETLMLAKDFKTYTEYCEYNTNRGYQMIPERLFDRLKERTNG